MKIIVDSMGSDKGPKEIVQGVVDGVNELGVDAIIVGRENIISKELSKYNYPKDSIEIINAEKYK